MDKKIYQIVRCDRNFEITQMDRAFFEKKESAIKNLKQRLEYVSKIDGRILEEYKLHPWNDCTNPFGSHITIEILFVETNERTKEQIFYGVQYYCLYTD